MKKLPFEQCPLPLENLAGLSGDVLDADREREAFQTEYGIDWEVYLRDYQPQIRVILAKWWDDLTVEQQYKMVSDYEADLDRVARYVRECLNKIMV